MNQAGIRQLGTALNKGSLFDSDNDTIYELADEKATPNEAFKLLGNERKKAVFYDKEEEVEKLWDDWNVSSITGLSIFSKRIIYFIENDNVNTFVFHVYDGSNYKLYYSTDGCKTAHECISSTGEKNIGRLYNLKYISGYFIGLAGGYYETNDQLQFYMWTSKDGITWTEEHNTIQKNQQTGIWFSPDGNENVQMVGDRDKGFCFNPKNTNSHPAAILIKNQNGNLVFEIVPYRNNTKESYNDGVYVRWGTSSSDKYLAFSYEPDTNFETVSLSEIGMTYSAEYLLECFHVKRYIVVIYRGNYSGEYTKVSLYDINKKTWIPNIYKTNWQLTVLTKTGATVIDNEALVFMSRSDQHLKINIDDKTVTTFALDKSSRDNVSTMKTPSVVMTVLEDNSHNILISKSISNISYNLKTLLGDFIGNGMKIETGSYIGTGKNGINDRNILNFTFSPKLVFITSEVTNDTNNMVTYGIYILNAPTMSVVSYYSSGEGAINQSICILDGYTLSWYSSSYIAQLNKIDTTYHYVAIG